MVEADQERGTDSPQQEKDFTAVKPAQVRQTTESINGLIRYYEWTEEMTQEAEQIIASEGAPKLSEGGIKRLEIDARRNWDIFYKQNTTNFYKDRHYLAREFTELSQKLDKVKQAGSDEEVVLLDLGCGVGNAFWPLVETFGMPPLKI